MSSQSTKDKPFIIVGAGIVGSALAAYLSEDRSIGPILLIDRSFSEILGSTSYAPGFLGQYNESSVLTKLAVDSLNEYDRFPEVFHRVGGLELASTDDGIDKLKDRCTKAQHAGLSARFLTEEDMSSVVPAFVDRKSFKEALYFNTDGVADPKALCQMYRDLARQNGVKMLETSIKDTVIEDGAVQGVKTNNDETIRAKSVIYATGIWTSSLLQEAVQMPVPAVPVAHPYVYTGEEDARDQTPFCRWPEDHVYARDHGNRYGIGSYAHPPVHVKSLDSTARKPWLQDEFSQVIAHAAASKVSSISKLGELADVKTLSDDHNTKKINGIFSVTPDNRPLLGHVPGVNNLWLATGIWITHAAGCARLLTRMVRREKYDEGIARTLDPARFVASDSRELEATALRQYNDIYRSKLGT